MADYAPGKFDCLVTDVSMPGRSGLDMLQQLGRLGSPPPVIIVTADANPATRTRAMRGGAHAYLTKPIDSEALLHHLRSALKRAQPSSDGG